MSPRCQEIRRLHRQRPRSRFVPASLAFLLALTALCWLLGDFRLEAFLSQRRLGNLSRFLAQLQPYPLQGSGFEMGAALRWAGRMLTEKGLEASAATLSISVASIVLAGLAGALLSLPAARSFASADPFLPWVGRARRPLHWLWAAAATLTRALLIFARAIPEYVWAFLFLALLGPSAWPAVLALALHNAGILGKLGAEVVEDLERAPLTAMRGMGASRLHIAAAALFPLAFSRFLLYFFYRWESCLREATVLGLLGIVSLGFWIQDARARNHYDEMFFYILLGAALVLAGDLLSALARELVRRAE